jgi:hypothetical protein
MIICNTRTDKRATTILRVLETVAMGAAMGAAMVWMTILRATEALRLMAIIAANFSVAE